MNLTKQQPVADLGNEPARRQVQTYRKRADGTTEVIVERLPSGGYMKVVKASGSVSRIPLHNGRANRLPNDPYKLDMEAIKPLRGAIPFGKCPQTLPVEIVEGLLPTKWFGPGVPIIPPHIRGRQSCRTSADGQRINADHPCQCILDLIEWRTSEHNKKMAAIETRSESQIAAAAQAKATEGLASAVKGVAEVVERMQSQGQKASK